MFHDELHQVGVGAEGRSPSLHPTPHEVLFCSNAIEAGIDFKAIAGWLGHQDGGGVVATTYGHLRQEHSAEMGKRMTFSLDPTPVPDNVTPITAAA